MQLSHDVQALRTRQFTEVPNLALGESVRGQAGLIALPERVAERHVGHQPHKRRLKCGFAHAGIRAACPDAA